MKYQIIDWTGNICFQGQLFDSFEDAWGFICESAERALLLDESRGIYIPSFFAKHYLYLSDESKPLSHWKCKGLEDSDIEALRSGPDHGDYWEIWDYVIGNSEFKSPKGIFVLDQDGDLFAVQANFDDYQVIEVN